MRATNQIRSVTLLAALLLLGCEAPTVPPPTAVSPAPVAEAPSSAEGMLRAAIAARAAVGFTYAGVSRVALPHRMGPSAAGNGKTLVRCWEVTRGGAPTGQWKLFDVAKIRATRLLPGAPFAPAIPAPTAEARHRAADKVPAARPSTVSCTLSQRLAPGRAVRRPLPDGAVHAPDGLLTRVDLWHDTRQRPAVSPSNDHPSRCDRRPPARLIHACL